jgi:hypothetical protein
VALPYYEVIVAKRFELDHGDFCDQRQRRWPEPQCVQEFLDAIVGALNLERHTRG